MAKFFFAAAVWGRLRLRDLPDRSAWDRRRIVFWDETYLDSISRLAVMGQKVRAAAELDDAIAASEQAPGIRALWIHEDLLAHAAHRWTEAQEPAQTEKAPTEMARPHTLERRVRAPAVLAAAIAAAFLVGLVAGERGPVRLSPPSRPNHEAAPLLSTSPKLPASTLAKTVTARVSRSVAATSAFAVSQMARLPAKMVYAVRVGTFENLAAAEQMRHLVLSKGYVVLVVRRGTTSQVITPSYRTRAQAQRVEHGFEGSGIHAEIVTLRAP